MDKRSILAFILIGVLTLIMTMRWQQRMLARQRREPPATTERPSPDAAPASKPTEQPPQEAPKVAVIEESPEPPLRDDIRTGGNSLKHVLRWTNRGGALMEAQLPEFVEYSSDPTQKRILTLIASAPDDSCSLLLRDPSGALPLDSRIYDVVEESPERLTFRAQFKNGLEVTKRFTFHPHKYHLDLQVELKNRGPGEIEQNYQIIAASRIIPEVPEEPYLMALIGREDGAERVEIVRKGTPAELDKLSPKDKKDIEDNRRPGASILWVGSVNKYFAAVLEAISPEGKTSWDWIDSASRWAVHQSERILTRDGRVAKRADSVGAGLLTRPVKLAPGESVLHSYRFFIGPMKDEVLAEYPKLADLVDYGWFGSISRLLLAILKASHKAIPNYGIGIIFLTILVRLVLHPLSRKSQIAMHKMQKLQPEIKKLQEKYKHDKQRLGREQMELMRKHGANPFSGCLPIFLQIPVFLGLFRCLERSFELRQQAFLLWIHDLSRPDTIAELGSIPIRVLPIVMTITWFIQMKTMPQPQDPTARQQQKIMMFMPFLFGYMMYGMASGLTLYWTVSMFLGIIEQKLIKRSIVRMEQAQEQDISPPDQERPPSKNHGKRGGRAKRG